MKLNKYQLFLKQSNFKENALLTSKLKNVYVDELKKSWHFEIIFKETPTPKGFDEFVKLLKLYFTIKNVVNEIDFSFYHESEDWLQNGLVYYHWILEKLILKRSSYSICKNFKVDLENDTFYLVVDKETATNKQILTNFKKQFNYYGLNPKIAFRVDETLQTNHDNLKRKKAKALTEVYVVPKPTKKRAVKTTSYRASIKASSVVEIKDIPHDNYQLDKLMNTENSAEFTIEGVVISSEIRTLTNVSLLIMTVADKEDAIVVKQFLNNEKQIEDASNYEENYLVRVVGRAQFDSYLTDVVLMARQIELIEKVSKTVRRDSEKEKRVEFHLHTKMSNLDGVTSYRDYLDRALEWGHKAIAFTDHDGVYAFPDIYKYARGKAIKPIYGVELNFVDETDFKIVFNEKPLDLRRAEFVVFDIETTDLSVKRGKIIEISALKLVGMTVADRFTTFVNPEEKLTDFTTSLTSITDDDLKSAPKIEEVLPQFIDFIGDAILVAHNASFDLKHLNENMRTLKLEKTFPAIDTLNMAKYHYPALKRHNLKAVSKYFKVELTRHHRAENDSEATAEIFLKMLQDRLKKVTHLDQLNKEIDLNEAHKHVYAKRVILIAKNQVGYKNLFKIISDSLTASFSDIPRLTRRTLEKYREGILVGSGGYAGMVFEAALNESDQDLKKAMALFDYIEVQPKGAYRHLLAGLGDDAEFKLESIIKNIVLTAQALDKLVIASGDVHYLDKEDHIFREIYINAKMVGGGIHNLANYQETPLVSFLTTDEMINEFLFLGEKTSRELVVKNTNILNNQIEKIEALPNTLYTLSDDAFKENLKIVSIKEEVNKIVEENTLKRYGKKPHYLIQNRIEKELTNIIENEFAPIYYISHLLTKKSLEDGYLVGSRGSVGSSLIANLMDITEVNPLKPHYYCLNCHFICFQNEDNKEISPEEEALQANFKAVLSGYDLKQEFCPHCGNELERDGQDIPFETFLGFTGDKIPDIDLNFSGDYQATAHNYVKELLGERQVFRAGTIQTVQERNAYGYVKGYLEEKNINNVRNAQIQRLAKGITDVKRSTGQHPGGMVVVPSHKEIFDVTPIQYPANDTTSEWKTTHFDYHSFEDNLLKLDLLGHDDPTMIKFLMDYVLEEPEKFPFKDAKDIPLDDEKVYQLFYSTESINLTESQLESKIASFGIPEFGTPFVRQMILETKPKNFAELVKVSGLSHGTNVWATNAQNLIKGDSSFIKIPFKDIIGCRDDIMIDLINFGMAPFVAFEIMEFVRRGKPSSDKKKWQAYKEEMERNNVPDWYIWSCGKIKYMFPKAHAVAYVLMAVRIAWFKVHHPLLFYSAFFSKRAVQFDHGVMVAGANAIRNQIKELEKIPTHLQKVKDVDLLTTFYVAFEMTRRGFVFLPVDIHKSRATIFKLEDKGLRMPFISIDGLGIQVALQIEEERNKKEFISLEDIKERTRINKTVFEYLEKCGAFGDLEEKTDIFSQGLFEDSLI
ncbi:MAG: PolC-type DNA polymerase III [Acholeplasmataceae bacterium]|jgi:DNA polymerase-3 subunit alpha (Gram-positive type)|nr:PolC-type DNA polymerase III [Acholeplasmataceae bacterium]MCK9427197.1 PolC-type DNA polymerase III [Acholeplasmataceae bacterium]